MLVSLKPQAETCCEKKKQLINFCFLKGGIKLHKVGPGLFEYVSLRPMYQYNFVGQSITVLAGAPAQCYLQGPNSLAQMSPLEFCA